MEPKPDYVTATTPIKYYVCCPDCGRRVAEIANGWAHLLGDDDRPCGIALIRFLAACPVCQYRVEWSRR